MKFFVYGVLGMLFTVALFAGGVIAGWFIRIRYVDKTKAAVHIELSEQEKRRQAEDARAFGQLVNYSPELAYGIHQSEDLYDDTDKG